MKLGMIGLGKMGGNMAARLLRNGHEVIGYNRSDGPYEELRSEGGVPTETIEELVSLLDGPRYVWLMIPAGKPVEDAIDKLIPLLDEGDVIIDGGNTFYQDTMRRAEKVAAHGLKYVDVGTSGGIWGITEGYSMMVGGETDVVDNMRPIFETLAPGADLGWGHMGPSGSGHFVKMVHNGIEYGIMQAYAEGFHIMRAKEVFGLDLHQIAEVWRFGSVVRSWLLDLTANALNEDVDLNDIAPWVKDSGEGRWTVKEAIDLDVPAPVITDALIARFDSRVEDSYTHKLLAAMRNQFGGHAIKKAN